MDKPPEAELFQWINFLWNEYRFRHNLYWYSVFLFGGTAILIYLIPFLLPQRVTDLGLASLFFPFIGFLLSIIGGWHIAAQRTRLALIGKKMAELRDPRFTPDKVNMAINRSWLIETVSCSISKSFVFLFLLGLAPISFIVVDFELGYLFPQLAPILFGISLAIIVLMAFAGFIFIDQRRKRHNHAFNRNRMSTGNEERVEE